MPEDDVKNAGDPSTPEKKDGDSLKAAEPGSDKPKGDEPDKSIPYARFKEVNEAKKAAEDELAQAKSVLASYQQEFGVIRTEADLKHWREYKARILKGAENAEDEGEISPKRLAEIRKVMRKADPDYAAMLEEREQRKKEQALASDAQYNDAEEIVRELAEREYGFKSELDENGKWKSEHESELTEIGVDVMNVIRRDPRLCEAWNMGHTERVVRKAFPIVMNKYVKLGKTVTHMKQEAERLKRTTPTLRGGRGTVTVKPPEQRKEKGLTPDTGATAWDYMQRLKQEMEA